MHSSGMRTVRCSSHLPGEGMSAWRCLPGLCLPGGRGCVPARREGVCLGYVCLLGGGLSARGEGDCKWGVCLEGCLPGGGSVCSGGYTPLPPLWTEFLTHACENITFPQLRLRAVINLNVPETC